jgi:hypothetical protein
MPVSSSMRIGRSVGGANTEASRPSSQRCRRGRKSLRKPIGPPSADPSSVGCSETADTADPTVDAASAGGLMVIMECVPT